MTRLFVTIRIIDPIIHIQPNNANRLFGTALKSRKLCILDKVPRPSPIPLRQIFIISFTVAGHKFLTGELIF